MNNQSAINVIRFFIITCLLIIAIKLTAEEDVIVAVVNDEVITRSDIINDLKIFKENNKNLPNDELIKPKLLEQRILYTIQLQRINDLNINPSSEQINEQIQQIAQQNNLTVEQLKQTINKDNSNGYQKLVSDIKTKLSIDMLRARAVRNKVVVTDEEIQAELRSKNLALYKYRLRNILISKPQNELSPEQGEAYQKKLSLLYQALQQQNVSFSQLAHSFSDAVNSKDSGDMGLLAISEIPSIYVRPLSRLKVGEVSKVIRSQDGLHIIKLEEKVPIEQDKRKQTKIRHILIAPGELYSEETAKQKIDEIYTEVSDNIETFSQYAIDYSQDVSSNKEGGDLGWVDNKDIHPAFVENMIGSELSQPFKTEFGWHIAQRTMEREINLTLQKQKDEIRSYLFKQESAQLFSIWLENLRSQAHIQTFEDRL